MIGFLVFSKDYLLQKKDKSYDTMNNELFVMSENEMPEEVNIEDEPVVVEDEKEEEKGKENNVHQGYYIGYLEIPKVNFYRGFVDVNSPDNNVGKNITIISTSEFPDVENGNFIIAGHSGTGIHSYFKHLWKLKKKDRAIVYYNRVKYTYEIVNIYLQEKTGKIGIYRDYTKNTLTLITCTKDNHKSQTVYIAELVKKEAY